MLLWVRVVNGAGASWVVRETIAGSGMFTLFSTGAVRSLLCEGQRSVALWRRWPTASLNSSQPKLLCGAVTATALQSSLCLRISIFFLCTPEVTCKVISIQRVNGSVTLDRSSRAAYHMRAEGVCTTLNIKHDWSVANHMLDEGVCTASYVKLDLAIRQPSFAQQRSAFSHFSPSTATLLAWKPDHSCTESTANDMFVSNSHWSSRPPDKSTGCIMIGPSNGPNICDRSQSLWFSICPYRTDRRPYKTDRRLRQV